MPHERETVGNRFDEDKGEEQSRIHGIARERQASTQQAPGEATGTESSVPLESESEATDSVLSWASGTHAAHVGVGDIPLSESIVDVAGVGGVTQFRASEPGLRDSGAGGDLTSAPNCNESLSGVDEIVGFHNYGGRK